MGDRFHEDYSEDCDSVALKDSQFKKVEFLLSGLVGAMNRFADAIAEPHDSLAAAIRTRTSGTDPLILARLEQIEATLQHLLEAVIVDPERLRAAKDKLDTSSTALKESVDKNQ